MMVLKQWAILKIKDPKLKDKRFLIFSLQFLFLFYLFVSCIPYPVSTYAEEDTQISEAQQSPDPDARSYSAFSVSAYWERMGSQAVSSGGENAKDVARENYRRSKEYLTTAIQIDPYSSYLHAKLAEVLIALEDYKGAKSTIENSLDLNPSNVDAHFWAGLLKYRNRDKEGALSEFKKAAELKPEHLKAQLFLASLSSELKDYNQAATAYSQIVRLQPYNAEYRYRLGICYSEIGEVTEAIDAFRAATMIDEDHLDAHFRLANLYARQSRNKEAIEECLIILIRVPNEPSVNLLLAQLFVSVSEFDKAISVCQKILSVQDPDKKTAIQAEAYYILGKACKEKGEASLADETFQESIDIYTSILEKEAENVGIHYDIAMVYDAKGDFENAEKHLSRLILLRSGEPNAYNYLGYMLVEHNKDLEIALEFIKKAVEKEPKNGAFHDSLGWAYFKLGDLDKAIAELEKAIELIPDDSDVHEHLGEAYLKKGGDYARKAVLEWEKALELKPSKGSLRQKLNELYKSLNLTGAETNK